MEIRDINMAAWQVLHEYIQETGKIPDVVAIPNPDNPERPLGLTPMKAFQEMWNYIYSLEEAATKELSEVIDDVNNQIELRQTIKAAQIYMGRMWRTLYQDGEDNFDHAIDDDEMNEMINSTVEQIRAEEHFGL